MFTILIITFDTIFIIKKFQLGQKLDFNIFPMIGHTPQTDFWFERYKLHKLTQIHSFPARSIGLFYPAGRNFFFTKMQGMLARSTGREKSQNRLRARPGGFARLIRWIFLFVVEVESPSPDRAVFRDNYFYFFSRFCKKYKQVFSIFNQTILFSTFLGPNTQFFSIEFCVNFYI